MLLKVNNTNDGVDHTSGNNASEGYIEMRVWSFARVGTGRDDDSNEGET